ncbi:MAG: hypothetical protein WBM86_03340 [Waterburya sp.]
MDTSFLHELNEHPLAGAMLIAILLLIHQIIRVWRRRNDRTTSENENTQILKQISVVVNHINTELDKHRQEIHEYTPEGAFEHIPTRLDEALRMLEKVSHRQDIFENTLGRILELSDSIERDLSGTNHAIANAKILSDLTNLRSLIQSVLNDLHRK